MLQTLWRKLVRAAGGASEAQAPLMQPSAPSSAPMTRDAYIRSPLPIADELRTMFRPQDALVIFDIGACEGEDSIRYAQAFPNARIYAFEPVPSNFETMRQQLVAYGVTQVNAFPVALSDEQGTAAFYLSSGSPEHLPSTPDWDYGNKASSLLRPDELPAHYPWLKFDRSIEVKTDTLANFCNARGLERIDFIHMDVQGAELKVLRGAGDLLSRVRAIWLEVERVPLYAGQPLADEMQAFMEASGFVKRKDTVGDVTGDHLYVRADAA